MQTTIQLPDAVYREGERIAQAKGFTLEELIVRVLERELSREITVPRSQDKISLPLIHSTRPGTLDLSNFDFDDLLT